MKEIGWGSDSETRAHKHTGVLVHDDINNRYVSSSFISDDEMFVDGSTADRPGSLVHSSAVSVRASSCTAAPTGSD